MSPGRRTVAVVTGSRAEYGLLRPAMQAVAAHPRLELRVIVAGAHLLPPARTVDEVASDFAVHARVEMQRPGEHGRLADAAALGRGIEQFARVLAAAPPDLVVVLGDRIEALAGSASASVGGLILAHLHGGDRAEGVADEAMRHAITKLAHLHLPATVQSAQRIVAMGESPERVHVVGSPALDELSATPPLADDAYAALGRPEIVMLLHPVGRHDAEEQALAARVLAACERAGRTLALHPNHDPGRDGIVRAIEAAGVPARHHLPRAAFVGLLRRIDALVGNSSSGLIEAAALGVPNVDIGPRQGGRQRAANTVEADDEGEAAIDAAIARARGLECDPTAHPFGDGASGRRVAELLAGVELGAAMLRKRNAY